jgi:hypothetical protein
VVLDSAVHVLFVHVIEYLLFEPIILNLLARPTVSFFVDSQPRDVLCPAIHMHDFPRTPRRRTLHRSLPRVPSASRSSSTLRARAICAAEVVNNG